MSFRYLVTVVLVLAAAYVSSKAAPQTNNAPQSSAQGTPSTPKKPPSEQGTAHPDEGQRVFDQNCSRCHNAPNGFSTRISGTVVRHMRVRAGLSQHDEQELLRFLNP
jgi:cytochrome c5